MDYGLNKPNVHTMPTVYYAKTAAFTGVRKKFIEFYFEFSFF
jgi:hypothetical protein